MYESLTTLLPSLRTGPYGTWIVDHKNDGSPEHPIQMPFVNYHPAALELQKAIYRFVEAHEEMGLRRYADILEEAGIKWASQPMQKADVSDLDGRTVMALLVGILRAERFSEGAYLDFCEGGIVQRWLARLEEIDRRAAEGKRP